MESSDQMCPELYGIVKKQETKDWPQIILIWVSELAEFRALHPHYCSRSILKFSVLYSKLQPIGGHIFVFRSKLWTDLDGKWYQESNYFTLLQKRARFSTLFRWDTWTCIWTPLIYDCFFGIVQIKALYNQG